MQRARTSCHRQVPKTQLDYLNEYVRAVNSFLADTLLWGTPWVL